MIRPTPTMTTQPTSPRVVAADPRSEQPKRAKPRPPLRAWVDPAAEAMSKNPNPSPPIHPKRGN